MYSITAASKPVGTTSSVKDGWTRLIGLVDEYISRLSGVKDGTHLVQTWEYFRLDLVARSLAPWGDEGLIDGPDRHLWGVTKEDPREH